MKNIKPFEAKKYKKTLFRKCPYKNVQEGIYENIDNNRYVTSLSFEQESEFDEGEDASEISQYPMEDILDKFCCHVSDFYTDLNVAASKVCYYEFASDNLENIINLRSIIGKHVYEKEFEKDGQVYSQLVIE